VQPVPRPVGTREGRLHQVLSELLVAGEQICGTQERGRTPPYEGFKVGRGLGFHAP
jgi:hypothetical protein